MALASAAMLASAGCGDPGDDDDWVAATGEEFALAWGRAVCARRVRSCCEQYGLAHDEQACAEAHASYARQEIERRAGLGATLNLRYASFCVRQVEAAAPDCGFYSTHSPLPPGLDARRPHCALLFDPPHGAAPPGAACTAPTDCAATGAGWVGCLVRDRSALTHACHMISPGREGDPCDERDEWARGGERAPVLYHCEPASDLYCDGDSRRCARRKPPQAPCRSHRECAEGSYCAGCEADEPCEAGVCSPFRGLDEPCDEAANVFCSPSMYCDAATGRCAPSRRQGEPCDGTTRCLGTCVDGVCDGGLLKSFTEACAGAAAGPSWSGSD